MTEQPEQLVVTIWAATKAFFVNLASAVVLLMAILLVHLGLERDSTLYLLMALVFLFVFCKDFPKRR